MLIWQLQMKRTLLGSEGIRIKDFNLEKRWLVEILSFLCIVIALRKRGLSSPSPLLGYKGIASCS